MRCKWCNENNPLYVAYHDGEWGVPNFDEHYLFEMLILESFQAGLSWECVLNKRKGFKTAFEGFDAQKVSSFSDKKLEELANNPKIIKNKRKIWASRQNAKAFLTIQQEFGSFKNFLQKFWNGNTIFETDKTTSPLSDAISKELKERGMTFVGSTIIYSFLQAIGVINSHDKTCFLYKKE